MSNRLFALLVGIDRYATPQQTPHLRGCVADVEATYALLTGRFAVPPGQIRLLIARGDGSEPDEARATRANIVRGWREHLAQAEQGDVVLFQFCGHGSQAPSIDPSEADGFDETLVAHDSRTAEVYDLADKELAALVHLVEQRGAQAALVLDCCHTLHAHARPDGAVAVRGCPPDSRMRPPAARLSEWKPTPAAPATAAPGAAGAAGTPSGWLPPGRHVLLAACRADEHAYEYRAPDAEQWHGAASYFLRRALAQATPATTWAAIHAFVLAQVHGVYPGQTPQLEGPGHLPVFGAARQTIDPYLRVTEVEGQEYVRVTGGAALGLTPGSRLALFPAGAASADEPLAYGMVEEVQVDHAWAKLDRLVEDAYGAQARIVAIGWGDQTCRVWTDDLQVRQVLRSGEHSPLLHLEEPQGDFAAEPVPPVVDLVATTQAGAYVLRDGVGELLADTRLAATPEGALQAVAMLEHVAVYRNILRLYNPAGGALQAGLAVEVAAQPRLDSTGRPEAPPPLYEAGHEVVAGEGQELRITVRNHSATPLYLAILALDADFGITRVYPLRAPYQLVQPHDAATLESFAPKITGAGRMRGRTVLKVMASSTPTVFDVLQLPKLGQGGARAGARADESTTLGSVLNGVRRNGTRDLVVSVDDPFEQWATRQFEVTVVSGTDSYPLPPDSDRIEVGDGWIVGKPRAFDATWSFGRSGPAARSGDGDAAVRLPPGWDNPEAAPYFRPVRRGEATPQGGSAPLVVEIAADAAQFTAISAAAPLQIELPVDDEPDLAGIVPVAFDGEFFYVVGKPVTALTQAMAEPGRQRMTCEVQFLPAPSGSASDAATLGLQRLVRLYFYKILARPLPADTGLRLADVEEGRAVYRPVHAGDCAGAARVALLIHGFSSSSRGLVEQLWSWVRAGGGYDLCLTFDYESFGTGIRRNAGLLAAALKEAGFGPEDGRHLDIYGHSGGALIGRALVELQGGAAYVDRLFMAGPPNAGTPLARGRSLLPWLANLSVNLAGSAAPALIAHWLLERVTASGEGLADLEPDSRFYQELNAAWRAPAQTAYFIQTGDNSRAYPQGRELARRLLAAIDSGLDVLFGGDNDLVVGVESARDLEGRWPALVVERMGVHHFHYFHSEEGQQVLARWLASET